MQFFLMLFHFLLTILKISCLREISESGHTLQGDRHQPRQAVNLRQAGVECRTALCWVPLFRLEEREGPGQAERRGQGVGWEPGDAASWRGRPGGLRVLGSRARWARRRLRQCGCRRRPRRALCGGGSGVIGEGPGRTWDGDFGKSAGVQKISKGEQSHEGAAVRGSGVKRRTCAFQVLFLSSSGESGPGQRDGGAGRASGWPGVSALQRGRSPVPVGAGFRPPLSGAREAELGFLRALALPSEPSEGAEGRSKGVITMTEPKFEEEMLSVLKLKKTIFDCRRHTASLVSGVRQGRDVCTASSPDSPRRTRGPRGCFHTRQFVRFNPLPFLTCAPHLPRIWRPSVLSVSVRS